MLQIDDKQQSNAARAVLSVAWQRDSHHQTTDSRWRLVPDPSNWDELIKKLVEFAAVQRRHLVDVIGLAVWLTEARR
jgi:hypothetical protein